MSSADPKQAVPFSASPYRRPLQLVMLLVGVAVLTGLAGQWLLTEGMGPWSAGDIFRAMLIAGVYTFCIGGANIAAAVAAPHYWPVRNRADVVLHVLLMSVATLVSFLLATPLVALLFDLDVSGSAITNLAVVSFAASLLVHGIVKGTQFYDRMRGAERMALEAELRALRAQINPHFLFNALNTIATLIPTHPGEAEEATENLADLFRYSLRASQQPTVTLADELDSVMIYLSLERARFGERLQVELDVPEDLRRALVPSLVLQPLVENAVKHGAGQMVGPCTIRVAALHSGGRLEIVVTDTGPGFPSTDTVHGTGLTNVQHRLRLLWGERAGLTIQSNGVRIRLPFETDPQPSLSSLQHASHKP